MALDGLNRFSKAPQGAPISRSRMDRSHLHKTTFNSGDLVPFLFDEVLPGDTYDVDLSYVVRGITPIVPVIDNSYIDFYFFFVPHRLCVMNHRPDDKIFEQMNGENTQGYWANDEEVELPQAIFKGCQPMSVANYLGLPIKKITASNGIAILGDPFVGYNLIWNEWFRDQNTQAPVDAYTYGFNADFSISPVKLSEQFNYGLSDSCLKVNKFHDYFTSALPAPQKGESVLLPLAGEAPITGSTRVIIDGQDLDSNWSPHFNNVPSGNPVNLQAQNVVNGNYAAGTIGSIPSGGQPTSTIGESLRVDNATGRVVGPFAANLAEATAASVNQIRQAFAIQKLLEKDARGGSRFIEILKAHFNVSIRNDVLQRPEYLGGTRIPLNITQVLQTSSTDETAPLGFTGAFSNTSGQHQAKFVKSFVEHGYIYGVCCVRTQQTYSQGINRSWFKFRRYDYYWPVFANLGEQAIYEKEIYAGFDKESDDSVFGYQEAWAEYRYKPSLVTGLLAPNAEDASLRSWTYTNDFSDAPVLNSDFMKQDKSNVGNTLAVTDSNLQFIADFYIKMYCTRPMPIYSIPGLIDHH